MKKTTLLYTVFCALLIVAIGIAAKTTSKNIYHTQETILTSSIKRQLTRTIPHISE